MLTAPALNSISRWREIDATRPRWAALDDAQKEDLHLEWYTFAVHLLDEAFAASEGASLGAPESALLAELRELVSRNRDFVDTVLAES